MPEFSFCTVLNERGGGWIMADHCNLWLVRRAKDAGRWRCTRMWGWPYYRSSLSLSHTPNQTLKSRSPGESESSSRVLHTFCPLPRPAVPSIFIFLPCLVCVVRTSRSSLYVRACVRMYACRRQGGTRMTYVRRADSRLAAAAAAGYMHGCWAANVVSAMHVSVMRRRRRPCW